MKRYSVAWSDGSQIETHESSASEFWFDTAAEAEAFAADYPEHDLMVVHHGAGCSCGSPDCPEAAAKVTVELCQSNSIGDRYYAPRIVEQWTVTEEEAERIVNEKRPNGFYVRRQAEWAF